MGKYFGTDGFRGEANKDLTVEHAYKVGRYIGWYFGRNKDHAQVVIGKDTRRSSYMLEYALVAGLTASGADVSLMHVTTTPSVAYITRTDGFDCGIMISASHNPYYDNGIKVLDYSVGRNRYLGYLMSIPTRAFKNIRVGLDCANGASSNLAKSVFDALGAKTYVIHSEPDGLNINTNCGSTHIESLQELVKSKGLDIGFAYDGDADRCLAVDEFGRVIDGDLILYVCGKYLKEHGELSNDTIVTTVMSNLGLYKALDKEGIKYEKTAVGDKYVNENMVKNGHCIGGEQSGHIIFSKHATTGDGILTSLKIMEAVIESKKTLAQLVEPVTIYPQLMKNVYVRDKKEAQNDVEVQKVIKEVEDKLGDEGRVLVRESGTEPVVRVMVEADTNEKCLQSVDYIISKMKERGFVIER